MTDWLEDRERIAAHVEDVMSGWHDTVERVPGEDGDDDTIVGRDGDTVAAILLLDEENVDAMVEAEADGTLAQWLRDELAEDAERDDDELDAGVDEDLEAAADAWLGTDTETASPDATTEQAAAGDAAAEDDFDLDDWDDPEADALIDELPR
ncbi:hypothetical protein SAMN04487783_1987 [Agrococcus baldri]|uniref:Uncharacterized protein n=1 Tax=Agrococcus baldri TaxID=153730 RepID=A0AA94HNA3_9MICO|nr:hypothetical protein [Agrococcus baldri]SFS15198.1 hypothetical protein SAMN04487783_1987 [Agrococcus baldri]